MPNSNISPTSQFLSENFSLVLELIGELFAQEENSRTIFKPVDIALATLLMCVLNVSAETIQMIEQLPSADTLLNHFTKEQTSELGRHINRLLKKRLLKVDFLKGVTYQVTIDITENPFYGKKKRPMVMGSKNKQRINYFIKYLTIHLLIKGHRYPVSFVPVGPVVIGQFRRYYRQGTAMAKGKLPMRPSTV